MWRPCILFQYEKLKIKFLLSIVCLLVVLPVQAEEITGKEIVLQGMVPGTGQLSHIVFAGDAVAGGGYYNENLNIFDISDPASPMLSYSHELPDKLTAICANGTVIYCSNRVISPRQGWLDILDVDDPYSPTIYGHYATIDSPFGVDVNGDYIVVGDDEAGIIVYDVSDSTDPTIVDIHFQTNAGNIAISGNLAAVREATTDNNRLVLYDISNKNSIQRLGSIAIPDMMRDMAFERSTIYLAQNDGGVLIYDLTDPSQPVLKSMLTGIGTAYGVDIVGTNLYVASGENIRIYDVTDLENPTLQLSTPTDGNARSVKVNGSLIAVGTEDSLQLFKLQDVKEKILVSKGSVSDTEQILHLTITGDVIAAGGFYNDTVKIFDVSDPTSPSLTYYHQIPDLFTGICSEGPYVYCSNRVRSSRQGWLDILDVSDPYAPRLLNHYRTRDLPYGLDVDNGVVMVGDYQAGITVLDVASPSNPVIIDTAAQAYAGHTEINGDLAAIRSAATGDNRLHIYDVSDKNSIRRLSTVSLPDMTHDLAFIGTTVYLAQNYAGVLIYDVTNPGTPLLKCTIAELGNASGVEVVGTTLYVAAGQSLLLYDVTDISAPILKYSYQLDEDARSVAVRDSLIAVGTEDSLQLFMLEENPLTIEYVNDGPFEMGEVMQVHWTSKLDTSGSAVKFELWNDTGWVADLGYAHNQLGEDITDVALPPVAGGDYRIRLSSAWDPQLVIDGGTFSFRLHNSVQTGHWTQYE